MGVKRLTTLQHKQGKQSKKQFYAKEEKLLRKKEIKLLEKIRTLPEELISHIYLFLKNDIKFDLSFYKTLFIKYLYDFRNVNTSRETNLYKVFKGYSTNYCYCTFYRTSPLVKILEKISIEKLENYLYRGTLEKYFNVAFPDEPNIKEYMEITYKNNPEKIMDLEYQHKNCIFEILDILSYFSTKANEWHARHCTYNNKYLVRLNFVNSVCNYDNYAKQTNDLCKENELIVKKIILGILHLSKMECEL